MDMTSVQTVVTGVRKLFENIYTEQDLRHGVGVQNMDEDVKLIITDFVDKTEENRRYSTCWTLKNKHCLLLDGNEVGYIKGQNATVVLKCAFHAEGYRDYGLVKTITITVEKAKVTSIIVVP